MPKTLPSTPVLTAEEYKNIHKHLHVTDEYYRSKTYSQLDVRVTTYSHYHTQYHPEYLPQKLKENLHLAIAHINKSLFRDAETYYLLGSAHFYLEETEEALRCLSAINFPKEKDVTDRTQRHNYSTYLNRLGEFYRFNKDEARAESLFQDALCFNPKNIWAYYNLGICYRNKKNNELAAFNHLKKILLAPDGKNPPAFENKLVITADFKQWGHEFEQIIQQGKIDINKVTTDATNASDVKSIPHDQKSAPKKDEKERRAAASSSSSSSTAASRPLLFSPAVSTTTTPHTKKRSSIITDEKERRTAASSSSSSSTAASRPLLFPAAVSTATTPHTKKRSATTAEKSLTDSYKKVKLNPPVAAAAASTSTNSLFANNISDKKATPPSFELRLSLSQSQAS